MGVVELPPAVEHLGRVAQLVRLRGTTQRDECRIGPVPKGDEIGIDATTLVSLRSERVVASTGMVEMVAALALAPWSQPLRFRPLRGWHTGASGTFGSSYGPAPGVPSPKESTAWATRGVRYVDRRTADPPSATLSRLPAHAIVVFATIYESGRVTGDRVRLRLARASRRACCDGTYVAGGQYALRGLGRGAAYSVVVRVYFGSAPTRAMRADAQRALDHLELPRPRA
jgi:hypothetical protein